MKTFFKVTGDGLKNNLYLVGDRCYLVCDYLTSRKHRATLALRPQAYAFPTPSRAKMMNRLPSSDHMVWENVAFGQTTRIDMVHMRVPLKYTVSKGLLSIHIQTNGRR